MAPASAVATDAGVAVRYFKFGAMVLAGVSGVLGADRIYLEAV